MKCALITGGTGGIGRAVALALCDEGYEVTATGLFAKELNEFDPEGRRVSTAQLDVTDLQSIDRVLTQFDRLDVLVNCAGTILRNNREHDPIEFAKVLDVNLTGAMRMCQTTHSLLRQSSGSVVNIASMLSFFGSAHVPAYSASKAGLVQLTKSLAIAWAPEGIRVNAIAPGWIATEFTAALMHDEARSAQILERTPMRRWGRPKDAAGAVVFLCSSAAAFITGAVLPVDGGYSCA